ncbi:EamA family transporter [Heyndrickxia ginsengihumi]
MQKKDLLLSCIAGGLSAFHFILWFESLNYTSVASSTVLVTLQPIFAFTGTYIVFKEAISFNSIVWGTGDFGQCLVGEISILVGKRCWAIYYLLFLVLSLQDIE